MSNIHEVSSFYIWYYFMLTPLIPLSNRFIFSVDTLACLRGGEYLRGGEWGKKIPLLSPFTKGRRQYPEIQGVLERVPPISLELPSSAINICVCLSGYQAGEGFILRGSP